MREKGHLGRRDGDDQTNPITGVTSTTLEFTAPQDSELLQSSYFAFLN